MKSYAQWSWTITVHEIHTYMKPKSILPWTLIKEKFTISWRPEVSDCHRNSEESGLQTHPQPIQLVPNSFNNFANQIPLSWPLSMERLHLACLLHGLKFLSKKVMEWTLFILWPVIICKKMLWSVIVTLWTPLILHSYELQSSMISIIPRDLMYDHQWSWMTFQMIMHDQWWPLLWNSVLIVASHHAWSVVIMLWYHSWS